MDKKAYVIKMGGDGDMSNALALAAVSPELRALRIENNELRCKLDEERNKRWQRNAEKIAMYKANIRKPDPWWKRAVCTVLIALYGFARLFVVKEDV